MVWIAVCASGRRSIRSGIRFKFQLRMPRNNITILNSQVASEQEREGLMTKPKKILVVDDDQLMRMMLHIMLTRAGYEVMSAENGQSAIEKVATEKPDLVLTDGLMPDMHGLIVCKAIKRLASPPKVVLLTASTSEMKRAEACAPDEILIKPVRAAELITCIEKLLADTCQFAECSS